MTVAPLEDPFAAPAKPSADMSPAQRAAIEDGGSPDVKRDGYGRYLLPTGKSGKDEPYTRATTFAKTISDTYTLNAWGLRMAIKGVAAFPDVLAAVASTPITNSKELNRLAELAKDRQGAKSAAAIGTALHAFTEQQDRGEEPNVPALWARAMQVYADLIDASGFEVVPELIERIVLEREFGIAGTFDRIVRAARDVVLTRPDGTVTEVKEGEYVVLDLKTGRDLSYGWTEIVIQLALYAHADVMLSPDRETMEAKPVTRTDVALVVHMPAERITVDHAEADLYAVDIEQGWAAAPLCAAVRRWRKMKKLAVPLAHVESAGEQVSETGEGSGAIKVTAEQVGLDEVKLMSPTVQKHIDSCRTLNDLADVVFDLRIARQFSPAVQTYAAARKAQIEADTAAG